MKSKTFLFAIIPLLLVGCNVSKKVESSFDSSSEQGTSSSESESSSNSSSSSEEQDILMTSIILNKKNMHLNPGGSSSLSATVLPSNATHKDYKWVIEKPSVIEYENGKVHALDVGESNIYAYPTDISYTADTFEYEVCHVVVDNVVSPTYDYDGYYSGLTWTDSEDLIDKLHSIISADVNIQKYTGEWSINQKGDQALDDLEMVDVVYSPENQLKTATYSAGKGWQREHAFAASLMTGFTSGDAVSVNGRATDFHNLFASNYSGNTSRGNKNFGIADPNGESYQEAPGYKCDVRNFEPSDNDKGRLSRAIFYMAIMYNQSENVTVKTTLNYSDEDAIKYGQASTTISVPVTYKPLQIIEDYVPYSKYTYTSWHYKLRDAKMTDEDYDKMCQIIDQYGQTVEGYAKYSEDNCQFAIGNLSTLLTWAVSDADLLEMQHNNYVYSVQNNRNPFVDYPELVDYCFGSKKEMAGSLSNLTASYTTLEMGKDEIHHYAIETAKREFDEGSTFTKDNYTIKAVKNDLTTSAPSYVDQTPNYTFTKTDSENGHKTLEVLTPINNINLQVKVNAGALDSCSYQGLVIDAGKNSFKNGQVTTVDGEAWRVSWTNETGTMGNRDSTYGLAFGVASGGKVMKELTFETETAKTVNKVYFKGSCKAGETINVTIKVGDTIICNKSITRVSGVTTAPEVVGDSFATLTGKVTIIINGTGASSGAIFVHTLAFNVVE